MLFIYALFALLFCRFATAEGASPYSYGLLHSHLCQLKARLGAENAEDGLPKAMSVKELQTSLTVEGEHTHTIAPTPLREAFNSYVEACLVLYGTPTGLRWVWGTGYINTWNMIHQAEEALIEVEAEESAIRDAIHDQLSLQGSNLSNRDSLLEKLIQAVNDLRPESAVFFKEHQPNAELIRVSEALENHSRVLAQVVNSINSLEGAHHITMKLESPSPTRHDAKTQARARIALREVRATLNDYRDTIWDGLIRSRNQLLGAITVTSLVTHILLCITLLNINSSERSAMLGAATFYMVGAMAGLFGRFYKESTTDRVLNDYGLSLARLVATPLLSGLAGIGGVLIISMLYTTLTKTDTGGAPSLSNIFQLADPRNLLAAAIFGLTPNLIVSSLQQRAEKYVNALLSSKSAERDEV